MILKPEHLAERKKYLLNNVEKGEESAYVSAKYALDYHDTIDALTQTNAELTAKLADLEGIDKVADHANGVIGLMQADIDALTAKLDAVRELAEEWTAKYNGTQLDMADELKKKLEVV